MSHEPTLEEILDALIKAIQDAINRKTKTKNARNLQAQRTSDGANLVTWGGSQYTVTDTSPSDSTIDGWDDSTDLSWLYACKARVEELQEPG